MAERIQINNQELLVLFRLNDDEYNEIILCLEKKNDKVFVMNNQIIKDKTIIDKIIKKYGLEIPKEFSGIIF